MNEEECNVVDKTSDPMDTPVGSSTLSTGFRRLAVVEVDEEDSDSDDEFITYPDGVPKVKGDRGESKAGEALPGKLSLTASFSRRCGDRGCDGWCQGESHGDPGEALPTEARRNDPSGSVADGRVGIDELARGKSSHQVALRQAPKAKPTAVRVQREEAFALEILQEDTRSRGFEAVMMARGAKHHMSEIYSPPRATELARQMNLQPGYALDLTARAHDGRFWDFTKASDRLRCWKLLRRDRPYLLIGSPPCTAFSALHNLKKGWPGGEDRLAKIMEDAKVHIGFCVKNMDIL